MFLKNALFWYKQMKYFSSDPKLHQKYKELYIRAKKNYYRYDHPNSYVKYLEKKLAILKAKY